MAPGVLETIIWAVVVFIPVMSVLVWLSRHVRAWTDAWIAGQSLTSAEREAVANHALAEAGERLDALELRRSVLSERTAAERARLVMETAQYETDVRAAERSLEAAVQARQQVITARAQAEADLAPEHARASIPHASDEMTVLGAAYAAYCAACQTTPYTFDTWIGDFEGLD